MTSVNRRDVLLGSSLLLGGILSTQTLHVLADTSKKSSTLNTKRNSFLSEKEFLLISQLGDIIMPRTDTPGAIEVGVAKVMDDIFSVVFTKDEQQKVRDGLSGFHLLCKLIYKKDFLALSLIEQTEFSKTLNLHFIDSGKIKENLMDIYASQIDKTTIQNAVVLFGIVKELTLLIFFRSEPGATKVLQYVAIPGRYNGCVPLKEIGRTWAEK